jgi:parvulin-like peptidyl-prolyl isomerase
MRRSLIVTLTVLVLAAACGPLATPEVIQDTSGESTLTAMAATAQARRATNAPAGPTGTPTPTSTPYVRPTDDPALPLDQPIVRVGDETITLGQFRQRVRYERFAALDNARRLIERVGLQNLNFTAPGNNPTADAVAAVFNTLANSDAFGHQVYDILIRGSIIRQEFKARGLTLDPKDVRDTWVRFLDLQRAPDIDAALPKAQDEYLARATAYSGLTRQAIQQIVETTVMGFDLRPLIGKENAVLPGLVQVKLKHIVAKTLADAEAAIAAVNQGGDFRSVACRYSIDPAARGSGGDLGTMTRSQFPAGLKDPDTLLAAEPGQIVGPLDSPLGWYIFRVTDRGKNADGDTQISAQAILVAAQSLANDLKSRAQQGEDFALLACTYSLDKNAGNGGDLGTVDLRSLPDAVAQAIQATDKNGLLGPIATQQGYEVVLVENRTTNIPKPADIDEAYSRAFNVWQSNKASSGYVIVLSDIWQKAIPADPLPRDVSPLMREENFGLPTVQPSAVPTPGK